MTTPRQSLVSVEAGKLPRRRWRFRTDRSLRFLLPVLSFAIALLVWYGLTEFRVLPRVVLPPPQEVATAMLNSRTGLLRASWITLRQVLAGFALAVVAGLMLAVALTYSQAVRSLLYPPLVAIQSLPKVALAPIFLLWLGFGMAPKVAIAFIMALFPILIETSAGLAGADRELHELARSLRASWLKTFVKIDFPSALPAFFAGMKVAVTLAVIGAIVGEFVAADAGLGFVLKSASAQGMIALSYAALLLLGVMGASLFALVAALEYWVVPWRREDARAH